MASVRTYSVRLAWQLGTTSVHDDTFPLSSWDRRGSSQPASEDRATPEREPVGRVTSHGLLKGCIVTGPFVYIELEQEPEMTTLQILLSLMAADYFFLSSPLATPHPKQPP